MQNMNKKLSTTIADREHLFSLINDLPTVLEVVTGRKPTKGKPRTDSGRKSKSYSKISKDVQISGCARLLEENKGEDNEECKENICGSCGRYYSPDDEFWICCDICDRWFHVNSVEITPPMAESIRLYKCPSCDTKRAGQ